MRAIVMLCLGLTLGACAHVNRPAPDKQFEAYRAQVRAEREAGALSAVEEQERLRDYFWQLYGKDAESAGHFAFAISLMRSAQAGDFPMNEALALVAAREKQIMTLKMVDRQAVSSFEYPN